MSDRPGFFETLLAKPAKPLSRLARFTSAQGIFYMAMGGAMIFSPAELLTTLNGISPDGQGLFRVVGFTLSIIGWFYFIGGRTGATSFGLATVADRVVVPFAAAGFVLAGQATLQTVLPFAILDPLLAFVAWRIWRTDGE